MCGIFRFSSRGAIFSTSPAIQLKPSVVTCSLPRVAINCMPTQMPKNGRALTRTASVIASSMPSSESRPRRQSAKAPTPGSTMRSARNTASGSRVTTIFCGSSMRPRGALERLRRRVQIAGAVIDDGNAHRDPPGSGNNPMMPPCGSGGGFEKGWPGTLRVGGGPPRSTARWSLVEAALLGGPAIEEAALGGFFVIGHDDVELAPFAPRQRPALQAWPLRVPSGARSGDRRTGSRRGRRRARSCRNRSRPSRRSSRAAPATAGCQISQSTPATTAQKWKPSRTNTNLSVAARSAP